MSLSEAALGARPIEAQLKAGLETLSLNQTVTFRKYLKMVLPIDGFVFWLRADLAAANLQGSNLVITQKGSLHFSSMNMQQETATFGQNRIIFTSENEVQDFNLLEPNEIYIGEYDGIRFSFSARGAYYEAANLFHYAGDAIYPEMESQIIDELPFDNAQVVSNSLPVWLTLSEYTPFYGFGNSIPLYPSYGVPNNVQPPYGVVDIPPSMTEALASAPMLNRLSGHDQLVQDTVKITLFGVRNAQALTFVDCVNQYSLDFDTIGLMNVPVIRDEKRTQSELSILAMKKTVEFVVSYYQVRVSDLARKLILKAIPNFYPQ